MVMANRTVFKNNNIGSGAGWHKDSRKTNTNLYCI